MTTRRDVMAVALLAPLAVANPRQACAKPPVPVGNGLAIGGFDCVAFRTEKKAVSGQAAFALSWGGANWAFKSAENRAAFAADPAKYAPGYNGCCAY